MVSLNEAMSNLHNEVVMATVLRPIPKYRSFVIERNLALVLVKCWVPHSKTFRLADQLVHEEEEEELRRMKVGKGARMIVCTRTSLVRWYTCVRRMRERNNSSYG